MIQSGKFVNSCPVVSFDRAGEDYSEKVREWIANPYSYFKSFGPEAREFQRRHRSERLRTMTLVAEAEKLAGFRPVMVSIDGRDVAVESWGDAFATFVSRLVAANPTVFMALQESGELEWLGCTADGDPISTVINEGRLAPQFADWSEVVARVQWLALMCGIRLNEVIVQVDPYTDEEWKVRKEELDRKRAADKEFMEGRRAAQKAWAEMNG